MVYGFGAIPAVGATHAGRQTTGCGARIGLPLEQYRLVGQPWIRSIARRVVRYGTVMPHDGLNVVNGSEDCIGIGFLGQPCLKSGTNALPFMGQGRHAAVCNDLDTVPV